MCVMLFFSLLLSFLFFLFQGVYRNKNQTNEKEKEAALEIQCEFDVGGEKEHNKIKAPLI
jgi:hypothetical protein